MDGTPYRIERIGNATLYLGDCRELRPTGIDVVITDPPYAEKTHVGARTDGGDEILIDFDSISDAAFIQLCERCVKIARRWVVMTCDWRHAAEAERRLANTFIRAGVWIKPNGMPQYTGDRPATGWEAVAILHRVGKKRWNGGGSHAVWNVPKVNSEHPTGKPIALVAKWVELFSDSGETIFDPYMGGGTTGVAAIKRNRQFVGCEKELKYFDIACRRIEEAARQPDMFIEKPKPATQESFL